MVGAAMNPDVNPTEFFVRRSLGFATSLPLADSIIYLRGLTELGGDLPAINEVRDALIHLSHSEQMMTQIADGQTELKFTP